MLEGLRKKGARLYLFRPVEDLSSLADGASISWTKPSSRPVANELEKYVIKVGLTILAQIICCFQEKH